MPAPAELENAAYSAKDAISHHMRWRITLQLAVRLREPLSPAALRAIHNPEDCMIGRWLNSPATIPLRRRPEYLALVRCHLEFHHEMRQIAQLLDQGDFCGADYLLRTGGSFQKAASAIAGAITSVDTLERAAFD